MNSVTVNISKSMYENYSSNPLKEGDVLKLKRKVLLVYSTNRDGWLNFSVNCNILYRPAPKSVLINKKSVFSKIKMKIFNSTTT